MSGWVAARVGESPTGMEPAFLAGGGDMGERMRAHDWAASPLGPLEGWPQSLKTAVSLMLNSRHPMFLAWGPELAFLYNDGYTPIFGAKHPHTLGRPFAEIWSEIWDDISPLVERALAGEATWSEDLHLVMERNAAPEDAWFTFSYSPVRDESGGVGGMFCACTETTARVLAERRLREREERLRLVQSAGAIGSFDWDMATGAIHRSPEYLAIQGLPADLPADGAYTDLWVSRVHPDDRERVLNGFLEDVARPGPFELEYRIVRPDTGETRWLKNRGRVEADAEGRPARLLSAQTDITEQKRVEAALRQSEERLRLAQDAAAIGSFDWDLQHGEAELSARYREIMGLTPDDVPSAALLVGRVHPDDQPRLAAELEAVASGAKLTVSETRIVHPDGTTRWVQSNARTFFDDEGVAVRRAGVIQDVTERRAAEDALRASEQRFRAAVDAVQGVLWTNNAAGEMEGEQPGWAALTGQDRSAYEGYGWASAVHPDDAQPTVDAWNAAVAERRTFVFEHRVRRADGAWRLFAIRAIPLLNADGGVREWVGVHTDITDQREVEAALKASEAEFRLLADNISQFAWMTDREGWIYWYNQRWYEYTGTTLDVMQGWGWRAVHHPEHVERVTERFAAHIAAGEPWEDTFPLRGADGVYRWFLSRAQPIRDAGGEIVRWFGTNTDIDDQRSAETALRELNETLEQRVAERAAALERAQEALRQSQKMEAVGQLTGGIAHDFNNLLTAVVGGLDIIKRRTSDDRTRRLAGNALEAAERGVKLTSQLLAFSRTQRLAVEAVDVNALVAGMRALIVSSMTTGVEIDVVLDPEVRAGLTDANQLELAVLNLCINARDAMPDGGRIVVSTSLADLSPADVSAAVNLRPGRYVVVAVRDDGPGMTAEVRQRAFDPFFTTKPVGQGTGLGLSQVYGIALQSGGEARIDSAPGEGTTVSLYLPLADGDGRRADAEAAGEEPVAAGDRRLVLVVDDDPDVRRFVVDSLDALGFRVLEAGDGPSGLDLFERERPDLLLLDFAMPGMTGAEVAEAARRTRPEQPVLFASGYADTAALERAAGDAAVLRKPFRMAELSAAVDRALGG